MGPPHPPHVMGPPPPVLSRAVESRLVHVGSSTIGTNVLSTTALATQGVVGHGGPMRGSRVRQSHRASPAKMEKQGWTREEDLLIVQRVQVYGQRWSIIAEALPGRTDDAVRSRYLRLQRKSLLPGSSTRGGDMWTAAEDARIQEAFNTLGPRWQAISELLPGRSPNAMRNRFLRCETNSTGRPNVDGRVNGEVNDGAWCGAGTATGLVVQAASYTNGVGGGRDHDMGDEDEAGNR